MKRAMVLVSFGTTYIDQVTNAIESIVGFVTQVYPTDDVYLAFSSSMIARKLKAVHDKVIPTIEEVLNLCAEEDYQHVIVQPLHLLEGKEYDKVSKLCEAYKGTGIVTCGEALLSRQENIHTLVNMLYASYHEEGTYLILLGHGTTHEANQMYERVGELIRTQHLVAQVATLDTLQQKLEDLVEEGTLTQHCIRIIPLMLVAGKHIREEVMALRETMVKQTGMQIEVITKGLGESKVIATMVMRQIGEMVAPDKKA